MKAEFSGHIDYSSVAPAHTHLQSYISTTDQNVKLTPTSSLIDGEHEIFMTQMHCPKICWHIYVKAEYVFSL